jgi:hypothetical protein
VQVRVAYMGLLAVGIVPWMQWVHRVQLFGSISMVTVGYCPLIRTLGGPGTAGPGAGSSSICSPAGGPNPLAVLRRGTRSNRKTQDAANAIVIACFSCVVLDDLTKRFMRLVFKELSPVVKLAE